MRKEEKRRTERRRGEERKEGKGRKARKLKTKKDVVGICDIQVKPRYHGHHWDQNKCPYYRVSLLSGFILRN